MASNKEWMTAPRLSTKYLQGVEEFLEFLRANKENLGGDDWYCCPCVKCRNIVGGKKTLRDIREHLICDGVDTSYTIWTHHGEIYPPSRARVAAELKAQRPNEPVTRTDVFLATHKRKDGSSSSPEVDAVITARESDRSVVESDINNDAVAKVFGRDGKRRVLGLGMGVSKTAIQHSASYKKALEEEHEANTNLQTQVKRLKEEIDEIKQVLSQGGMQHSSTYNESSSQAQDGSPREEVRTGTNQNNTSHTREGSCRLLSYLRKEITIAVGRVMGLSNDERGCYRIIIDGILKDDELLLGGDTTFGDLTLGDIISWSIFRTVAD